MWFAKYIEDGFNWKETKAEAIARGAKYYYWASECGFNAMYNGDTYIFFDSFDALPEPMRVDAEKYAKTL